MSRCNSPTNSILSNHDSYMMMNHDSAAKRTTTRTAAVSLGYRLARSTLSSSASSCSSLERDSKDGYYIDDDNDEDNEDDGTRNRLNSIKRRRMEQSNNESTIASWVSQGTYADVYQDVSEEKKSVEKIIQQHSDFSAWIVGYNNSVEEVVKTSNVISAILISKLCPFKKGLHEDGENYNIYINLKSQYWHVRCSHSKCLLKKWPAGKGIKIKPFKVGHAALFRMIMDPIPEEEEDDDLASAGSDVFQKTLTELELGRHNHKMFADLFFVLQKEDMRITHTPKGQWFSYSDEQHRWVEKHSMRTFISNTLSTYIGNNMDKGNDNYIKTLDYIKDIRNLNHVLTFTEEQFFDYDSEFLKRLNMNTKLIGMNNGVYDGQVHSLREGKREDWISFSTHMDYIPYDVTDTTFSDLENFFAMLFPEQELREYHYMQLGRALFGYAESIVFPIGTAANGKTTEINLWENSFGDYFLTLDSSLLTQESKCASPEKLELRSCRIAVVSEPENNKELNGATMKRMTGEDTLSARPLFSNKIEKFKVFLTLFIVVNNMPTFDNLDGGVDRRIVILPYTSTFSDTPERTVNYPNRYKKDIEVKRSKVRNVWPPYFLALILKWYKKSEELYPNKEGLPLPKCVVREKLIYQSMLQLDHYIKEVISENKTDGSASLTSIQGLYKHFQSWWLDPLNNESNSRIPSKKDFMAKVCSKIGNFIERDGILGWPINFVNTEQEIEQQDV